MYTTTPGQTAQLISKVQDVADTYLQTLQVVYFLPIKFTIILAC